MASSPSGKHRRAPTAVVGVGASAGGVEALKGLVAAIPADFPAAVLVAMHTTPTTPSVLPMILDHLGGPPALAAADGEELTRGRIYVARPNRHLLVRGGYVHLSDGPRENRVRPAIDPLFRSIASGYGERGVGVVLSGTLADGALGLLEIRRHGGLVFVQDPGEAAFGSMPRNAMRAVEPDLVGTTEEIAAELVARFGTRDEVVGVIPGPGQEEMTDDAVDTTGSEDSQAGEITAFRCPDCGGSLWEGGAAGLSRFRCRVGHSYSDQGFLEAQGEALEGALWAAVVALEERGDLLRRLQARMGEGYSWGSAADEAERQASAIRSVIAASIGSDREAEA